MRSRLHLALLLVSALGVTGAPSALAGAGTGQITVHVQNRLSVTRNVDIAFHPNGPLPAGGYYYAVIVLKPYKHYTRTAPPPCAVSSDMFKTAYGYPRSGQPVRLVLTRTASHQHRWCRGGTYVGGVYAVPNPPPCNGAYPCESEYSEASPCWEIEAGRKVCGVVAHRIRYAYPRGLPAPLEKGTRIIGYFHVSF